METEVIKSMLCCNGHIVVETEAAVFAGHSVVSWWSTNKDIIQPDGFSHQSGKRP